MYHKSTEKLLNIINSIDYKNKINKINKINILKITFFNKLYNQFHSILTNKEFINSLKNISVKELNHIPPIKDSKFISNKIKEDAYKLKYGYLIEFDNNKIYYYSNQKVKVNNINPELLNICRVIKSLKILFNRESEEQIVHFYMTNQKKKFPKNKNTLLGPNESNSGVTFSNFVESGEITIYRREECLKVLIHELIHANFIDKELIFINKQLEKQFNNYFCTDYTILLNEAFTEAMATILNLFYIHITLELKKKELNKMFVNELKYSIYIYSKIMNYYNIENLNEILKQQNLCKSNFPQKTNIIAYYVFKPLILLNLNLFGSMYEKYSIDYRVNNSFIEHFIKFILGHITDLNDIIIHKDIINKNIINKDIINKDIIKNNSLRMTLYEI